jgi:hypothetical protein
MDSNASEKRAAASSNSCGGSDDPRLRQLSRLFDALAAEDESAFAALLAGNPELTERGRDLQQTYGLLRQALGPDDNARHSAKFRLAVEQTSARLAAARMPAGERPGRDDSGILTELTARLAPAEAAELFRRIAPRLALGILQALDQSAKLETVRVIVDHLCRADVQQRLRAAEHVRDGILDEISSVLQASTVRERIDRDRLLQIMQVGSVLADLAIMERCILVGRSAA